MDKSAKSPGDMKDSRVVFHDADGLRVEGEVRHVTRQSVAFEIHGVKPLLQVSQSLSDLEISPIRGQAIFKGKAVIEKIVDVGSGMLCEAGLRKGWQEVAITSRIDLGAHMQEEFGRFIQWSQRTHQVSREFRLVIAEIQMFLQDLRSWLDEVQLAVQAQAGNAYQETERAVLLALESSILPLLREPA